MAGLLLGATVPQSHKGPSDTQCSTCLIVISLSHKEAGTFIYQFLSLVVGGERAGIYSLPLLVCRVQEPSTILWPEKALRQTDTHAQLRSHHCWELST